jgi:hypothetical protein
MAGHVDTRREVIKNPIALGVDDRIILKYTLNK